MRTTSGETLLDLRFRRGEVPPEYPCPADVRFVRAQKVGPNAWLVRSRVSDIHWSEPREGAVRELERFGMHPGGWECRGCRRVADAVRLVRFDGYTVKLCDRCVRIVWAHDNRPELAPSELTPPEPEPPPLMLRIGGRS